MCRAERLKLLLRPKYPFSSDFYSSVLSADVFYSRRSIDLARKALLGHDSQKKCLLRTRSESERFYP
ncbi:hypothetical protein L596_017788 [Steinernema carpocapsae]|uniref:Uncharacterized protein n=1 Tax=Steinernema carpocapsae TaxID=34508 RepID=A0A4U5N2N2_STECR|nr:hypothetical protein L596_017788 [Steinernema carpocapsae]